MAALRFVWVGKLKEPFFRDACAHYMQRLARFHGVDEQVVKDAGGKLPPKVKADKEGEAILARLDARDHVVLLDEGGTALASRKWAARLARWVEDPGRTPCFIIGGPFGLSDAVRARAGETLALGPMTLPHELARVVLLEQLYRAASINAGLPYHHD